MMLCPSQKVGMITYFECSWDGEKVVKTEKTCTDYTKLDEETQNMNLTEG